MIEALIASGGIDVTRVVRDLIAPNLEDKTFVEKFGDISTEIAELIVQQHLGPSPPIVGVRMDDDQFERIERGAKAMADYVAKRNHDHEKLRAIKKKPKIRLD